MTFAAVMIFRRERDSGVLELLLVTPLSSSQIIYRQICGFWRQFALPLLLFLGLAEFMVSEDLASRCEFNFGAFVLLTFIVAPVIGFYASLRFRNFAAAFFLTAFVSLAVPLVGPELGPGILFRISQLQPWFLSPWSSLPAGFRMAYIGIPQVMIACGALFLLRTNLERRTFAEGRQ